MSEKKEKEEVKEKEKDKNEEKKNPYHREYSVFSNVKYILRKIRLYCPILLGLMIIGIFSHSIIQYLASFIGKFVIDIVQVQSASVQKDFTPLIRVLLIACAIELVIMLLDAIASNRCWYYMINARMRIITERVKKALSMNYQMFEEPDVLDMEQKAQQATGGNDNGIEGMMHNIYDLGINAVLLLITLTTVVVLDWRMLIALGIVGLLQHLFFTYTVKKDRREVWDKLAPTWRKIGYMQQSVQNFDYAKDIRLFSMKGWLSEKQHEVLMEKQDKMLYSRTLWIYNSAFAHGLSMISTAVIYAVMILAVVNKNLSIGNFTLYLGLAMNFTSAMTSTLNTLGTIKKNSHDVSYFRAFIDMQTEEKPGESFSALTIKNEDADSSALTTENVDLPHEFLPIPKTDSYTFTFRNVCFRYAGAKQDALHNLNITFSAGERLAVVGLNGAGKTTFVKLLCRLYDPTEGEILLNGVDIRLFKRNEYYRLFAPVFQNVELFAFPMAENVSMLPPDQTDRDKSRECLIQSGLGDKLAGLKDGVDTELLKIIYDDGIDLSGGEKQKLALARALYKNAPIMVLDEPTAALDALAEYNLYCNFDKIIGKKSAVYISHRLSSTRFCHHIAMFENGEMVEYGTHEELLHKDGAYAEMFRIQSQYYKEEGKEAVFSE
ncbi:MAG: ABC transporter ATP-binding protein/permease [Lachnospiraceae bacterium]|nr:ABC transporter ATP-binding protein/permease [Lachnospiraceae bacterium]